MLRCPLTPLFSMAGPHVFLRKKSRTTAQGERVHALAHSCHKCPWRASAGAGPGQTQARLPLPTRHLLPQQCLEKSVRTLSDETRAPGLTGRLEKPPCRG